MRAYRQAQHELFCCTGALGDCMATGVCGTWLPPAVAVDFHARLLWFSSDFSPCLL